MSYLDAYHAWLNSPALSAAEKAELASIQGDDKEIESRFFDQLSFGTAGLRGTMGVGLYRMNVHVIRHATQAFAQVILEEAIPGFEVGCAVMGTQELVVGEIDEIELSQGFFNFTEKYTLKTSAIHVPARVSPDTARRVKETAKVIYRALGCTGFVRVDCFLTPEGQIVFNEVNTIPGFTEHSRFPGMMKAAGFSFPEILDTILGQVMAP